MGSHIVLFDARCGLCEHFVRFVLRRDREARLLFAPLDGATAEALRERLPQVPGSSKSVVLVSRTGTQEVVHLRSRAVLAILAQLPRPWSLLAGAAILPAWLLDPAYALVAALRRRLFAPPSGCALSAVEERERFLS